MPDQQSSHQSGKSKFTDIATWRLVVAGKFRRDFRVCLDPVIGTQDRFATCSVRVSNKVMRGSFSQGAEHCINDCPEHEKESELWQPGHKNASRKDDDSGDCPPRRMVASSAPRQLLFCVKPMAKATRSGLCRSVVRRRPSLLAPAAVRSGNG
jgi:hypothetical protein